MQNINERAARFRNAINDYIQGVANEKLKPDASKKEVEKFETETWLKKAADLSTSIQLTTHPLKATHADISINESTSPFVYCHELVHHNAIGSHSLKQQFIDGTGNAAALGVFKFMTEVQVDGKPLFKWILAKDPDLLTSISDNQETANEIIDKLSGIDRRSRASASNALAKQLYWLVGDEPSDNSHYQLLQPCFSSGLAQTVHAEIRDTRFGEANKLARQAWRAKKPHEGQYRNYQGLVIRKLGGTKPQNISQLNSERGGINYLLDSSPPNWGQERKPNLLNTESALYAFKWFENVGDLLKKLQKLLKTNPKPNLETRQRREAIERELGQQLAHFGATIRGNHAPGWTREIKCRLPLCEQLWLDSERTELPARTDEHAQDDIDFKQAHELGNWPDEVAHRFGAWLNEQLRATGINTVGDSELRHWSRQAIIEAHWPIPIQRRARGGAA